MRPEGLAETLSAVRTIQSAVEQGDTIPVSVLASIFYLTNTVRAWALDPESMLVRNNLIQPSDSKKLLTWVMAMETEYRALLGALEEREGVKEP